ncbi:MAG: type II toxin-antitoxin system RelE/ParE family toxin [Flavobacteriaceae bacterium]
MVYSPVFTRTAQNTYFEMLNYLKETYSDKAVVSFVQNVFTILEYISNHPTMFPESPTHWKYRRALVDRYTSIYYSISEIRKQVVIHLFWHNKRNPKYLKVFLGLE